MAIPTVEVLVVAHDQDGSPSPRAQVTAKLSTVERYHGFIVPDEYSGITDENGECRINLFPNELGTEGSEYKFKIVHTNGKTVTVYASIPNSNCSLHQVAELDRFELRGAGQVVTSEIGDAVNEAIIARDNARAAELAAVNYAILCDEYKKDTQAAATTAITKAAESSTNAIASADSATASADSAAASEASRVTAVAAQSGAEGARDLAQTYRNEAQAARNKAQLWAEQTTDIPVETGKYSAKHHAIKASNSASIAATAKDTATAKASEASSYAAQAAASVSNAAASATSASSFASAAAASRDSAAVSAGAASTNAATAVTKATEASISATNAANSASAASVSKVAAESARDTAIDARDDAIAAKDAAQASEASATASKNSAATSAANAASASAAASSSATSAAQSAASISGGATDAVNAKNAALAAQATCETIRDGLQTASTHSHDNKTFLDGLNETSIAGYNVIRAQSLPPAGNYKQGTFCVVDAYEPKKVYLNVGLWWINIPQTDSVYGKITKFDDVTLLWRYEDGGQRSAVGPDPVWSYSGHQYAEDGSYVGLNEPTDLNGDGQLWWSGPAYTNLLTYSEQFDKVAWGKDAMITATDTSADPFGGTNATRLIYDNTTTAHLLYRTANLTQGVPHTFSFYLKPHGFSEVKTQIYYSGVIAEFVYDMLTETKIASTGLFYVDKLENGWFRFSITGTPSVTATGVVRLYPTRIGSSSVALDNVSGFLIYGAQFTKTDRPVPYVKTEATTTTVNSLTPIPAIHGDKGVWCGPSYTNLFTHSEDITQSRWVVLSYTTKELINVNGKSVGLVTATASGGARLYQLQTPNGTTHTASCEVKLKPGSTNSFRMVWNGSNPATFDLVNGEVLSGLNATISCLGDDWYLCTAQSDKAETVGGQAYVFELLSANEGDGFYITKTQFTNTPATMPYVKTYSDPVTVASAAGTSGDNGIFFDMAEEPDGVELVYNGGFDTNTDGWTAITGVISNASSRMRLEVNNNSYAAGTQPISTVIGAKYRCTAVNFIGTGSYCSLRAGTASGGSQLGSTPNTTTSDILTLDFIATSTVTFVSVLGGGLNTTYTEFDNISVQRLTSPLMKCFEKAETDGVELVGTGTEYITQGTSSLNTISESGDIRVHSLTGEWSAVFFGLLLTVGTKYRVVVSNLSGTGRIKLDAPYLSIYHSGTYEFVATSANLIFARDGGACDITCNISIQRLQPATCTVAALVTMGVSKLDLPNVSTYTSVLTARNAAAWSTELGYGVGNDNTGVIITSWDGTNIRNIPHTTWSRNEQHIKIVQTNADGTQYRVGNKRVGIDSAIQWSSWVSFDGSFNPLTALRLAYGNTVPLWFRRVMVSNKGGMSDAEILTRMEA